MKSIIQRVFNKFGYKLVKNKGFETVSFEVKNIFNYFDRWVTIFEIDIIRGFNDDYHLEKQKSTYKMIYLIAHKI